MKNVQHEKSAALEVVQHEKVQHDKRLHHEKRATWKWWIMNKLQHKKNATQKICSMKKSAT